MMVNAAKVKLGLCPIGKFVFSHEDACRQKRAIQERLQRLGVANVVDLDEVLPDGLVRDQRHVEPVVAHFQRHQVDALFVPHCNFGTEGAVGMIARKLGLPTLLWGPRDEAPQPDGSRLRDTLCGLLASSKVLHKLGVPFTYIENCRLDDPPFDQGLETFLRAAHVAGAFRKGLRIGLIGGRIDFFWTTIVNESELLERFRVEVQPFDMVEFIRHARSRVRSAEESYRREIARFKQQWTIEDLPDEALANIFAVRDQMLACADDYGLDGIAIRDFNSLMDEMGAYCCLSDGMAAERVGMGFESDIHGAISDLMVRRAALDAVPGYLVDLTVRHPTHDNAVLLWHGAAPPSLRDPDDKPRLGHHWILPSPLSGMTHFRLKQGDITIARFDGDGGDYQLAVGQGRTIPGPWTLNNYVWMQVNDWPRWERQLIEGPFIHHAAMIYGSYEAALVEAVRYIPGLSLTRLGR